MTDRIQTFKDRAEGIAARVYPVADLDAAIARIVELCAAKPPLNPQVEPGPEFDMSQKVLAAPNLPGAAYEKLAQACEREGISLVEGKLRQYPWGIDMGVTLADFGIADTGTLVLASAPEETRLATMLCEWHVAILSASAIRESAMDMAGELETMTTAPGSYTAFISGASRTADIERVLALGVHGPLELHIMLVED